MDCENVVHAMARQGNPDVSLTTEHLGFAVDKDDRTVSRWRQLEFWREPYALMGNTKTQKKLLQRFSDVFLAEFSSLEQRIVLDSLRLSAAKVRSFEEGFGDYEYHKCMADVLVDATHWRLSDSSPASLRMFWYGLVGKVYFLLAREIETMNPRIVETLTREGVTLPDKAEAARRSTLCFRRQAYALDQLEARFKAKHELIVAQQVVNHASNLHEVYQEAVVSKVRRPCSEADYRNLLKTALAASETYYKYMPGFAAISANATEWTSQLELSIECLQRAERWRKADAGIVNFHGGVSGGGDIRQKNTFQFFLREVAPKMPGNPFKLPMERK